MSVIGRYVGMPADSVCQGEVQAPPRLHPSRSTIRRTRRLLAPSMAGSLLRRRHAAGLRNKCTATNLVMQSDA